MGIAIVWLPVLGRSLPLRGAGELRDWFATPIGLPVARHGWRDLARGPKAHVVGAGVAIADFEAPSQGGVRPARAVRRAARSGRRRSHFLGKSPFGQIARFASKCGVRMASVQPSLCVTSVGVAPCSCAI